MVTFLREIITLGVKKSWKTKFICKELKLLMNFIALNSYVINFWNHNKLLMHFQNVLLIVRKDVNFRDI